MPISGPPAPGWSLDEVHGFRLYDGTQNDYFGTGDLGVVCHLDAGGSAFFRGIVQASKIQGPLGGAAGTGPRMWLDFTAGDPQISPAGATPGVSPYWAITDNNGVIRVEAGYLAALGISPLQWGMRVNDASGNPIFDSLGLISVMMPISGGFANGVLNNLSSTTDTPIPGASVTFTITRQTRIWILFTAYCHVFSPAVPTSEFGTVTLYQNGVSTGTQIFFNNVGFYTYAFITLLGSGSYTFDLRASVNTGTDSTSVTGVMFPFLIGAA